MIKIHHQSTFDPWHLEDGIALYHGDCVDVMRSMPDNSVDAIVTDPPYGLSFMGKKWDYDVPSVDTWSETLRVLKPGGHLLAFGGSRTYHRVVVNIEDAGFEIRDQIMWLYGSGFPKSLDVSKAIDKAAGVERVPGNEFDGRNKYDGCTRKKKILKKESGFASIQTGLNPNTAPSTSEAKQWDGWGTALKPAHEPICVARKPLIGTVAENVLEHGTGGLNIDACRIDGIPRTTHKNGNCVTINSSTEHLTGKKPHGPEPPPSGRHPANLILDPEAGAMLDRQSGDSLSAGGGMKDLSKSALFQGKTSQNITDSCGFGDSGGASRFFYCAKASKADRDEGLEGLDITNNHPTVKPTALMQYLVRLVTPPAGTVLDPFMGSGSTGKATVRESFKFIGIDNDKENLPIAKARIKAPAQVELR